MSTTLRQVVAKVPAVTFGFWVIQILATKLGATVGDYLNKPIANGGLALDRCEASAALAVVIVFCILLIPQRVGRHPGANETA